MGRFSALIMTLVSPYAACFFINLVLACLVVATQVDPCPNNEHEGTCGHDQAFFLVLTTFHAGSWGHVTPAQSQRVFVSLAAALGFLWPLATLLALLARMHQLVLMRLEAGCCDLGHILCLSCTYWKLGDGWLHHGNHEQ